MYKNALFGHVINSQSLINLGDIYFNGFCSRHNYKKAKKFSKLDGAHYYKNEEKAALHDVNLAISAGDYDKARELLDRLPESPEATYALGIVEALCGNYTEAETILEKAVAGGVCQSENALRQIKEYRTINLKNTNNKH